MKRWAGGVFVTMLASTNDARAEDDGVFVRVDGPRDTVVEVGDARGEWRLACTAPCGERLARARHYRVRGGGLARAQPIELGEVDEAEPVTITIEQRSSAESRRAQRLFNGGLVTTAVSAAVFAGTMIARRRRPTADVTAHAAAAS